MKNGPGGITRKTIARKLALQKHLLVIEQRISELEKLRNEQRSAIEIQQSQLESIPREVQDLRARGLRGGLSLHRSGVHPDDA